MRKSHRVRLHYGTLPLPPEVLKVLGLRDGDELELQVLTGTLMLSAPEERRVREAEVNVLLTELPHPEAHRLLELDLRLTSLTLEGARRLLEARLAKLKLLSEAGKLSSRHISGYYGLPLEALYRVGEEELEVWVDILERRRLTRTSLDGTWWYDGPLTGWQLLERAGPQGLQQELIRQDLGHFA